MPIKAWALLSLLAAGASAAQPQLLAGLKGDWAFGPGPALSANTRFSPQGKRIWVLPKPQALVASDRKALALLFNAQDMVQDGQGKLWFVDGRSAGSLDLAPDLRSAALKARLLLPSPAWRLADGGSFGILAYGTDPEDGQGKALRLSDRRAVFSLPVRLLALQGTPQGLALATPEGVFRLGPDGSLKNIGFHRAVRSLAYVDGAGLVAATEDGAWLLREGAKPLPFLSAPGLRLRSVGSALYALIPAEGGILRLRGLEDLKP